MHRFFVPPGALQRAELILRGEQARQIREVLRLRPGDLIAALDNSGVEFRVELNEVERGRVRGRVVEEIAAVSEPSTRLSLYQSLLKAHKFEWVLQKGTELGIAEFVPIVSAHSVAEAVGRAKRARWEQIIVEAAEQCGATKLPRLHPVVGFGEALEDAARIDLSLIPWEEERERDLRAALDAQPAAARIRLFIGPEGGFDADEIKAARAHGVLPITLGRRILRAETAGLVASSAIFFARGDLSRGKAFAD